MNIRKKYSKQRKIIEILREKQRNFAFNANNLVKRYNNLPIPTNFSFALKTSNSNNANT